MVNREIVLTKITLINALNNNISFKKDKDPNLLKIMLDKTTLYKEIMFQIKKYVVENIKRI